jgi:hypothetical protein
VLGGATGEIPTQTKQMLTMALAAETECNT